MASLLEKVRSLPDKPGVYIFRDKRGRVLYIGKALSLRKRVGSYLGEGAALPERIGTMLAQAAGLEFIVTESELEALILESNLIKAQQPRYNILLKDDKHYPFLKLDLHDPWPWIQVTRRVKDDGALYFGPYVPASAMWELLSFINKAFPLRKCQKVEGNRLCLEYHLGRCLGPCEGLVGKEEYDELVQKVRLILEGKDRELEKLLERQMREVAEALEFEKAAKIRDQLFALRKATENQAVLSPEGEDLDVFAFAQEGGEAQIQLFLIRRGRLIGREAFSFESSGEGAGGLLASLLKQFYVSRQDIPSLVLVSHPVEDQALIEAWLSAKAGRRVSLLIPKRGRKARILRMAVKNAQEALSLSLHSQEGRRKALEELKVVLRLPSLPKRIEAYDISNISGLFATGSLVVMEEGRPKKADYKRFRIKAVEGPDDYAMLGEVLRRRFAKIEELPLPDLILLDGGRGQLNVGLKVAEELGLSVPMVGLAKACPERSRREEELVFHPELSEPIRLSEGSRARLLLQQVRDEAHRFALHYHRKLRERSSLRSLLDEIPGIGLKRKRVLLQRFGSLHRLKEASVEELRQAAGLPLPVAQSLQSFLTALLGD